MRFFVNDLFDVADDPTSAGNPFLLAALTRNLERNLWRRVFSMKV